MTTLSIIIPTYNAEVFLPRTVASLDALHSRISDLEVIAVDDCSTDGTTAALRRFARTRPWLRVEELLANTGSPSEPRNRGVALAKGEFVFFLDADDEVLPDGLVASLALAERGYDVVRAPLIADNAGDRRLMNTLDHFDERDAIAEIIEHQSTTVPGIIRRSLLRTDSWRSDLHLGEDTLFWIDVLSRARRVGYQPEPDFVYHKTRIDGRSSTTQKYEERELLSHLEVWETASDKLAELGLDYFALRGRVALQTALTAMCRYNAKGISRPSYERFRALLTAHPVVRRYRFDARIQTVLWSILDDDYDAFLRAIRTRLVIAGMDLKFIKGVIPELEKTYEVRIDRWTGHDAHDEQASLELLDWADVLFCEWMLGNAVWYSHHKRPHQRLVVRCHLFEIQRDYGFELDVDAVDRFICVSLPTMEDMLSRFGFPRSKVRVVPNFIDTEAYKRYDDPDKPFRLAMVGILPARKGFHRALQVLKELRNVDPRYTLTVMGKTPGEVHWVANDPAEARYYELCDRYIAEHNLESAVVYAGWVDTRGELGKYGVVLSMSDFESFHVGAAEAFAAGSVPLVLPWSGAEFIYPKEFVVQEFELTVRSIAEIAQGAETP